MEQNLTLSKSVGIHAPTSKVWEALTNPELIKVYFFGTTCITDWKKGSSILYKGKWEGKPYEDKGNILDIENEKFILYNYWSSFSGTEDIPENYAEIKYELTPDKDGTLLTVTQRGFKTEEALRHSESNWVHVLDGVRQLVEQQFGRITKNG